MGYINSVSTEDVKSHLDNKTAHIVDIRPIAAYNGWKLKNEKRGGHIPGAKSIPFYWTQYMDWVEVLEEKNLNHDDSIIVYGYNEQENKQMAKKLLNFGYRDVRIYCGFVENWVNDPKKPLDRLLRYEQLVHPEWLQKLINNERPESYENDDFVICHSHYDYIEDYQKGHIPGAVPLNTNWLESTETWNRRSPEKIREVLLNMGICKNTTVIVYGRFSAPVYDEEKFPGKSAGHLGAIRMAAIMLYAGVKDVRILNGGITSWETAGYELSTETSDLVPADEFGSRIPGQPEFMIDTPEAKELLKSDRGELVSIRSWPEFIGERSGYHYIKKKGRIPGAVFGNCGSDAYHMENYRNFDHTMREYQEIAEKWREGGITPDKKISFYCGTGWRGSEAFWNAYLMGWPNISVYDGGWFEWISDPANPIEKGEPNFFELNYKL